MVVIKVFRNGILTNQASFKNQKLADIWLNEQLTNKSFGNNYQIKVEYA